MIEISTRGRRLSATECCEYFCTPPGKRIILENALQHTTKGIGHYNRDPKGIINFLRKEGIAKKPSKDRALIEVIASAKPCRIVIIDRKQIPQKPNFLKVEYTKNVSQEDEEPIDEAVAREIQKTRITDIFGGYKFRGHHWTNTSNKMIALIDVMRGCIYDSAIHTAIRVDCYAGKEPLDTGGIGGVTQMPSFHDPKKEYIGGFEGIPIYKTRPEDAFNQGFEITAATTSPRELFDIIKFGRKIPNRRTKSRSKEQRWDHHFIFAYQRIAEKFEEQGWKTIKPYIEPSAEDIQFYWKLMHNCLAERWDTKKQQVVLQPLTIAQAEYLLWKREAVKKTSLIT